MLDFDAKLLEILKVFIKFVELLIDTPLPLITFEVQIHLSNVFPIIQ